MVEGECVPNGFPTLIRERQFFSDESKHHGNPKLSRDRKNLFQNLARVYQGIFLAVSKYFSAAVKQFVRVKDKPQPIFLSKILIDQAENMPFDGDHLGIGMYNDASDDED